MENVSQKHAGYIMANTAGLFLHGKLVASQIKSGNRKEDGKPYALRENTISTGSTVVRHTETLDPALLSEQSSRPLDQEVTIIVESARTEMGMTSVRGEFSSNGSGTNADKSKS
tara:strand:+ start:543 stop:884 length:342 start_codon:yes stop_codon:yes gene_type:complete